MLYIWVKDDGVGVCRNQTKAEENKEKTPHTHVGWENTKKMLRILYGDHYKFQVWSEPGKGTEIEIAVPLKEVEIMWKVIAADDEGYIREALQKTDKLGKNDCSLESVVSDGQELLEKIRGEMPDIVITDIQMPGVDGLEVCKYIYETLPGNPGDHPYRIFRF